MTHPTHTLKRLAVLTILAALMALVASSAMADEALDAAFETLETYRFGDDRAALKPIDDATPRREHPPTAISPMTRSTFRRVNSSAMGRPSAAWNRRSRVRRAVTTALATSGT